MHRICLIHWKKEEAAERLAKLRSAGFDGVHILPTPAVLREIRKSSPDAFVIDLSRLPSQGRDVALIFRQSSVTRRIPIVFVDGAPEKIEVVKKHFPDAIYTKWSDIKRALLDAIANPPANPMTPKTSLDGYAGAPLVKKLGIRAGFRVALVGGPRGFGKSIPELPENVQFVKSLRNSADLVLWFLKEQTELKRNIAKMSRALSPKSGLWICWPKRSSGVKSDLTQEIVRKAGLSNGLVDYKVCSIDDTWSGLKFCRRKER